MLLNPDTMLAFLNTPNDPYWSKPDLDRQDNFLVTPTKLW
jgi:hypothetical protein